MARPLLLLGLCAASLSAQLPMHEVFPLHADDRWTYSWDDGRGQSGEHAVAVVDTLYGSWFKLDGSPFSDGQARWFALQGSDLVQWQGHYAPVLSTASPLGLDTSFSAYHPALRSASFRLEDADAVVDTPAGRFTSCRVYAFATSSAAGLRSLTLAPGVGVVAYTMADPDGLTDYRLVDAEVGGTRYPEAAGVRLALRSDRLEYSPDAQGAVEMAVELSVETLAAPFPLHFASGQRYELRVAAASAPGQTLWSWAATQTFSSAAAVVDLRPGQPLAFRERIRVPGLTAGEYILRVELHGAPFAAELPFRVAGATPTVPDGARLAADLRAALADWYGQHGGDAASSGGASLAAARAAVDAGAFEEILDADDDPQGHDLGRVRVFAHPDVVWPGSDIVWFLVYDRATGAHLEAYPFN